MHSLTPVEPVPVLCTRYDRSLKFDDEPPARLLYIDRDGARSDYAAYCALWSQFEALMAVVRRSNEPVAVGPNAWIVPRIAPVKALLQGDALRELEEWEREQVQRWLSLERVMDAIVANRYVQGRSRAKGWYRSAATWPEDGRRALLSVIPE